MSRTSFNNYGRLAKSDHLHTVIAGRYAVQQGAEKKIPQDILRKLNLKPENSLLEIGCGTGNLLIPLSDHVGTAAGIDHPAVIERLEQRHHDNRVKGIAGNFLDLEVAGLFDRILIYSVMHDLSDEDEVIRFIDKALGLLKPGGKIMIGDLPNQSLKERFLSTQEGKAFAEQWKKALEETPNPDLDLSEDPETVEFDDDYIARIVSHVETGKFNCTVLDQPADLPFGHTRQDILIQSRE